MYIIILLTLAVATFTIVSSNNVPYYGPSINYNGSIPRWDWYPYPGRLDGEDQGRYLNLSSGVDIWYTTYGKTDSGLTPVLLLHGGYTNSNWMYRQANLLAQTRQVILQDTRGEGRSPYAGFTDFSYDDFARDAIALLDSLQVEKVAIIGWSDGGITGLNLAMNYTDRVDRLFVYGSNAQANQSRPGLLDPIINSATGSMDDNINGTTYSVNGLGLKKKRQETLSPTDPYSYASISPTPEKEEDLIANLVFKLWVQEPNWGPEAFIKIKSPTWILDGDRDGLVRRNQVDAIAAWIPFAGQLIIPHMGHFGLLADWRLCNTLILHFVNQGFDGPVPYY